MGSKRDCFDNAVAESFFATLKKELIHGRSWPTRPERRPESFEYFEFFSTPRRRHPKLGTLCPADFQQTTLTPTPTSLATSPLAPTNKLTLTDPTTTKTAEKP